MPLNITSGPGAGSMGLAGFATGKRKYEDQQRAIERQLRQQEVQNTMSGLESINNVMRPFVNDAINKQTRQWQDKADLQKQQATFLQKLKPENITARVQGDLLRESEGLKAAYKLNESGMAHLRSMGPSEAGIITRPNGERVEVGGGSGRLNEKQMLAAMNQLDRRTSRLGGMSAGSGLTPAENFTKYVHKDEDGNMFSVEEGSDGTVSIKPLGNNKKDRSNSEIKAAMSYRGMMDLTKAKGIAGITTDVAVKMGMVDATPEQIRATTDMAIASYLEHFPKTPEWVTDAISGKPEVAGGGERQQDLDEYSGRQGYGGMSGLDMGTSGGGQGFPAGGAPAGGAPAGAPAGGAPAGGAPASDEYPPGYQPTQADQDFLKRMSDMQSMPETTRRGMPDLAREMEGAGWDNLIDEMSETNFSQGNKFSKQKLESALDFVRDINKEEVALLERSGGQVALHQSGHDGNEKHLMRVFAIQWIKDSISQYQTSVDAAEGEGPPKLLYGDSPIPMPDPLSEFIVASRPAREPARRSGMRRTLGLSSYGWSANK